MTNTITTLATSAIILSYLGKGFSGWVERYFSQIVWGLNSLGCLGYLHGKEGKVSSDLEPPSWLGETWRNWSARQEGKPYWADVTVDWGRGEISWEEEVSRPRLAAQGVSPSQKKRRMRLGKWLRKAGATEEQIREFETRKMACWEWRISASPWSVLTMSHNRPWTSCMRPDGAYEKGPLSDMRAGAAVLFWYRPGASQPCGREILRPVSRAGDPVIIRGGTTYGSGGTLSSETLSKISGVPVDSSDLLANGITCLCEGVYDDNGTGNCSGYQKEDAESTLIWAWRNFLRAGSGIYEIYQISDPKPIARADSGQPSRKALSIVEGHLAQARNQLRATNSQYWGDTNPEEWVRPAGPRRNWIESRISRLEKKVAQERAAYEARSSSPRRRALGQDPCVGGL